MIYAYARCSINEDKQGITRQIRELKAAGAVEVIFEYEHGDAKVKRNLQMLLDTVQESDTIITLEVSPCLAPRSSLVRSSISSARRNCA